MAPLEILVQKLLCASGIILLACGSGFADEPISYPQEVLNVSSPSPQSTPASPRPQPDMQQWAFYPDGSQVMLYHPDIAEPLRPFEVTLQADETGDYQLDIGRKLVSLEPGEPVEIIFTGTEGWKTLKLLKDGQVIGQSKMIVEAATFYQAEKLTSFFDTCRRTVQGDRQVRYRDGKAIHTNPNWVRDHIHEMKAYKYWAKDLTSYIDTLIELQHPEGFFYEILSTANFSHIRFVDEKFTHIEPKDDLSFIRLEVEADVEYLIVEGAYNIWQAAGNADAMKKRLPALLKGIDYYYNTPTRWDSEHKAIKRPFTIDTWDFTFGYWDRNRRIEPDTPMGIMHGDNSGLYQALRQLANMYEAAGRYSQARKLNEKAEKFRQHINRLCFNGTFYTHQILLQPVETGRNEEDILSLSNTYDINRGLPTHEMAVSIIDEYQRRRRTHKDTHFAEWFSIDPAYPVFGPYKQGQYINGGISSFAAGELAKASFNHGREAYGADILRRLAEKVEADDNTIYFLYSAEGENMGGGPSGWGAAAVISAMIEGLAGIEDESKCFEDITVSPRFAAAEIKDARVCARYGPSGAYTSLNFHHSPADKKIEIALAGVSQNTRMRVFLPPRAKKPRLVNPEGVSTKIEQIEESRYLVFDLPKPLKEQPAYIVIEY